MPSKKWVACRNKIKNVAKHLKARISSSDFPTPTTRSKRLTERVKSVQKRHICKKGVLKTALPRTNIFKMIDQQDGRPLPAYFPPSNFVEDYI